MAIMRFELPVIYDLIAVFLFALTGSLIALKRGFDPIGVAIITIISGAGGALLRDSVFLNLRPAVVTDWRYAAVIIAAIVAVLLARSVLVSRPIAMIIIATEAIGIGINSVYGSQRALSVNASIYAAIIVGLCNAVGGRLMRDTVIGKKRKNLNPSRMFGVASAVSIFVFLILSEGFKLNLQVSAWVAILVAFIIRIAAIKFDVKTKALRDYYDPSERIVERVTKVVKPYTARKGKPQKQSSRKDPSDKP